MSSWDERFMALAEHIAGWSKDPSAKVGAVIVDEKRRILGLGFNGFPRGVPDNPHHYADKSEKYPRVVHAELNAILNASGSLVGSTIYVWPFFTCAECAKAIIQAGIATVVSPPPTDRPVSRYDVAKEMYEAAGVVINHNL